VGGKSAQAMKLSSSTYLAVAACAFTCATVGGAESEPEEKPTEVAVHVARIQKATLHAYVTAFGRVEPEPASAEKPAAQVIITPAVAGQIVEAKAVEGQRVEAGAILYQLDSRLADLAVEKARSAVEFAQKTFERQQSLVKVEGVAQKAVQDAENALASARKELTNAETQRALLRITSPISGTVTRANGKPGQAVDATTVLAEVIDTGRLAVTAAVPSAEVAPLKPGAAVQIIAAHDAKPMRGTLVFIAPQVDSKNDTVTVRVSVPAESGLRPGQFVQVRVVADERADRLAVPVGSVVKTEDGSAIFVVEGENAAQRPVKTGLREAGLIEVEAEGLEEGTTVVTIGASGLPKETKVRVVADK
jgi:membrane fusion protein (multidrug efflux system)